jgi:hypothetical protein
MIAALVLTPEARSGPLDTNLLDNPGFESNLEGWTTDHGAIRTGGPDPHGGAQYLMGSTDGAALSYTSQTIDLIAAGFSEEELDSSTLAIHYGGYQAGWSSQTDSGKIEIIVTDGENELLRSDLGWFYSNYTWELKEETLLVPVGARSITFGFHSQRTGGYNNDGYLDDAFLILQEAESGIRITAIERVENSVMLHITGLESGQEYSVFRCENLKDKDWVQIDSFTAESSAAVWSEPLEPDRPHAFYFIGKP